MSDLNLLTIAPYFTLGGAAVIVMLVSTFSSSHRLALSLTLAGLAGSLVVIGLIAGSSDRGATTLLRMDNYALFFIALIIVSAGLVALTSFGYLERTEKQRPEYYVLVLLATLGASALVASSHFASFFLGLEILSVSLYGLIAYPATRTVAIEAAIKYLVLAASTAAFLVLGMALVYSVTGTLALADLSSFVGAATGLQKQLYASGLVLILAGVGFKLAVVPFHMWTPDIYQGAPAPVTALVASVSKTALFALLLRYVTQIDLGGYRPLFVVLSIVAVASMVVGNLLALLQANVKRLLAYSSISHMGYLLVPLLAGSSLGRSAVAFYLAAYSVTMIGALGVVAGMSGKEGEPESIEDYRGLGRRSPWLAGIFTVFLLSLAGIPITAGFIGKFLLVDAGAGASHWALVIVLVLTSVVGLFYYLRLTLTMWGKTHSEASGSDAPPVSSREVDEFEEDVHGRATRSLTATLGRVDGLTAATLIFAVAALLFLGLYPRLLLHVIERAASSIG
jgi:NADH-quinone oxidoreductase subunit N